MATVMAMAMVMVMVIQTATTAGIQTARKNPCFPCLERRIRNKIYHTANGDSSVGGMKIVL